MEAVDIEAILGSIKKWDLIAHGIEKDEGCNNCPLCAIYHNKKHSVQCILCPVERKVGMGGCCHTPYQEIKLDFSITLPEWIKVKTVLKWYLKRGINKTLDEIENEIEFLIRLLPEDHKLREL